MELQNNIINAIYVSPMRASLPMIKRNKKSLNFQILNQKLYIQNCAKKTITTLIQIGCIKTIL